MKRSYKEEYPGQSQSERDMKTWEMQRSPYDAWTQLNDEGIESLIMLNTINPLATNILYFLIKNVNNYNAILISQKTLSLIFNKSVQSINYAIKALKEHNFINIYKDGRGNMYFINASLIWKSYGTNYNFAEYNAKIIFSEEEIRKMNFQNTLLKKSQNIVSYKHAKHA